MSSRCARTAARSSAPLLALACHKAGTETSDPTDASSGSEDGGKPGTPVKLARVRRATLQLVVTGPGRTDALEQQKVPLPSRASCASCESRTATR